MKGRQRLKICLAASGGGHLNQLMKLSESWQEHDRFFITTVGVVKDDLAKAGNVYVVGECNREHPVEVLKVLVRVVRALRAERPDVIFSTGAAVGCLACIFGKLMGCRVVWMDSITNVEVLSLSGRIVRHVADLFLVQWPGLERKYSGVKYAGAVI